MGDTLQEAPKARDMHSNKYFFPYLMACYFCSSNYKRLVLVSCDPPFISKYFKMTFNLPLYVHKLLEHYFLTTQV